MRRHTLKARGSHGRSAFGMVWPIPMLGPTTVLFALLAGTAAAQPTPVAAVCLTAESRAAVCACAEQRMHQRLDAAAYRQFEAMAQAYLADPSGGWAAAAEDVAVFVGGEPKRILQATRGHQRQLRAAAQACRASIGP